MFLSLCRHDSAQKPEDQSHQDVGSGRGWRDAEQRWEFWSSGPDGGGSGAPAAAASTDSITLRFLCPGFKEQIYDVYRYLPPATQVVLISATLPHEILEMTNKFMTDPIRILVKR